MVLEPLLFTLKGIPQNKIWKKPNDIACFFTFFYNIGHNLAQILPQNHTRFDFFPGFQWSMLANSINIKNFNWSPVLLKNFCKNLKILLFLAQVVQKWGPHGRRPPKKTILFSEIIKPDLKLSKPFYFIKRSYVLAGLWVFFYIVWCFLLKSVISSHNSCELFHIPIFKQILGIFLFLLF